jgi:organic radical activating enzyme
MVHGFALPSMKSLFTRAAAPQPSCRDYGTCTCVMDPATIGKHVFIELSSVCNLLCEFCAYTWSERKGTMMPLDLLEKILKDLRKLRPVEYIMFSALGEPTLHPQFGEACRLVRQHGFHLIVTTNGSRLNESMSQLPIDEMFVSFNTPTAEAYVLKHAKGLDFDAYVENLGRFLESVPMYDTYIYLFTENRRDYPGSQGMIDRHCPESARRLEDLIRRLKPGIIVPTPIPDYIELYSNVIVALKRFTLWANCNVPPHLYVEEAKSIPGSSCNYYKHHINVLASGDVTLCCGDYDGGMRIGNVKAEPLYDIFARKDPNIDLAQHEFCRRCKGTVKERACAGCEAPVAPITGEL